MDDLRTYDGNTVPRNVRIAIAVILTWSLAPLALTLTALPDLIAGDVHGRALRASDWISAVQPLLLLALFVLVAELIRRRKRRAWLAVLIVATLTAAGALLINLTSDFDVLFLISSIVFPAGLFVAALLPGLRQWCDE